MNKVVVVVVVEGQWFIRPGLGHHVVSLDKKLYSALSLSTQVYGGVPVTKCWE